MRCFIGFSLLVLAQGPEPVVGFRGDLDEGYEVFARLSPESAKGLSLGRLTQEQGESALIVTLLSEDKKPGPPMLGKYERTVDRLTFTPRFPLEAGQSYRATLKAVAPVKVADLLVPKAAAKAPPKVVKIYPTADVLPANNLKFYIYFDRPMRGGEELFNLIQLVDDKGKVIDDPWLVDEIWDAANNCLIIYIHPGRIKWGVYLRELLGPVLYDKRNYSLVIRGKLTDLAGNKIGADVVKKFRTTPEDRVRIDLSPWKLTSPKAMTRDPLTLTFQKSIDHRSLQRFLIVKDEKGKAIDGVASSGPDEKSWSFTPTRPWQNLGYHVDVDGELEDIAGNTPLLPFDHELKSPKLPPQRLRFEFQPRGS